MLTHEYVCIGLYASGCIVRYLLAWVTAVYGNGKCWWWWRWCRRRRCHHHHHQQRHRQMVTNAAPAQALMHNFRRNIVCKYTAIDRSYMYIVHTYNNIVVLIRWCTRAGMAGQASFGCRFGKMRFYLRNDRMLCCIMYTHRAHIHRAHEQSGTQKRHFRVWDAWEWGRWAMLQQ